MYKLLPKSKIHAKDESNYESHHPPGTNPTHPPLSDSVEEAIFAGGSFWKLEAVFGLADGVVKTATGYCGGTTQKPSYREVCEGRTGHTEAVRVIYDNRKTAFKSLCEVFWHGHDPTSKRYLDFGVGTHQRSAIFCKDEEQKTKAHQSKVERQMKLNRRIVTKILVQDSVGGFQFYLAENIHQKYYLQQHHVRICEVLGLRSTDQFVGSHLACKLNGILGNYGGSVDQDTLQNLIRFLEMYDLPVKVKQALEETIEDSEKNRVKVFDM